MPLRTVTALPFKKKYFVGINVRFLLFQQLFSYQSGIVKNAAGIMLILPSACLAGWVRIAITKSIMTGPNLNAAEFALAVAGVNA